MEMTPTVLVYRIKIEIAVSISHLVFWGGSRECALEGSGRDVATGAVPANHETKIGATVVVSLLKVHVRHRGRAAHRRESDAQCDIRIRCQLRRPVVRIGCNISENRVVVLDLQDAFPLSE